MTKNPLSARDGLYEILKRHEIHPPPGLMMDLINLVFDQRREAIDSLAHQWKELLHGDARTPAIDPPHPTPLPQT